MCALSSIPKYLVASIVATLRDESGVTAIEYGLIAALIAVAAVTVMTSVGTSLSTTFTTIASDL